MSIPVVASSRRRRCNAAHGTCRLSPRRCSSGLRRPRPGGTRRPGSGPRGHSGGTCEVVVPPVQGPLLARFRVAEPRDREARPLGAEVLSPRRTALQERDRAGVHVQLVAELIDGTLGTAVIPRVNPASDAGEIGLGQGHGTIARAGSACPVISSRSLRRRCRCLGAIRPAR